MGKYSCLDCQNYCPQKEVVDGYKEECNGMVLVPITKVIERHCDVHPRVFKKWWKENSHLTRENAAEAPSCLLLHEHLQTLGKMINLAQEILDKIDK